MAKMIPLHFCYSKSKVVPTLETAQIEIHQNPTLKVVNVKIQIPITVNSKTQTYQNFNRRSGQNYL